MNVAVHGLEGDIREAFCGPIFIRTTMLTHSIRWSASILASSLVLVGSAAAQTPAPQTPRDKPPVRRVGTAVISGRVVDGMTGDPVARARVRANGVGPQGTMVLTSGDGTFALRQLPAGNYTLSVEKVTYLQSHFPESGRSLRTSYKPITLQDGEVLQGIAVRMYRGSAISGRVVDAHGDPLEMVSVRAYRLPLATSPGQSFRASSSTDDIGEFRIGRLEPGGYLLQIVPRSLMDVSHSFGLYGDVPQLPAPLETYYPNAATLDQAQPIQLRRGQSVAGLEIQLQEGVASIIAGIVSLPDGQRAIPSAAVNSTISVRAIFKGLSLDSGSHGTGLRPDGSFRLTLAPGEYLLEARVGRPQEPRQELVALAQMSLLPGAVENIAMTVGSGGSASGRIVFESGSPPASAPSSGRIPFDSPDGLCRSNQVQLSPDWSFKVDGLLGRCGAPSYNLFGRWSVKAVVVNGANILDDDAFVFQAGQHLTNVQVIVTDRRTDLTFQVSDDRGQTTREYVAIVFPVDKKRWRQTTRYVHTFVPPMPPPQGGVGAAGPRPPPRREAIEGLPAGDYYVVAVDDLTSAEARDATVLEQLSSSSSTIRVTLSHDGPASVSLQRAKFAELVTGR